MVHKLRQHSVFTANNKGFVPHIKTVTDAHSIQ